MANSVLDAKTGELLEYRHLIKRDEYREVWTKAYAKELARLAQGMKNGVAGTNTIFFMDKKDVPADRFRDVTYGQIVCNY